MNKLCVMSRAGEIYITIPKVQIIFPIYCNISWKLLLCLFGFWEIKEYSWTDYKISV